MRVDSHVAGGNSRTLRIGAEIQRVVAELVTREVKDPRVGSATITAVSVSPDQSVARVSFVPFGQGHELAEVQAGLTRAAGFLRGEVGRRLGLRHAPRLEFVYDVSIERAAHLTHLIDSAVRADRDQQDSKD